MNELESLKSIFKDRIFKIPDHQRGYAWTTKQLKDFWEDLVNLPPDKFHYTGLLSLKRVEKNIWENWNDERWLVEERRFKAFHIVGGQQRLTTFVIFIQAISEQLKSIIENKDKKETEQRANRCICPVCGAETMEIRGKAQCTRCHTICETCCEGGRQ